ncbi:hypothetical protein M427DRAFT_142675 [Gonapodya prolifera JEL478]|uniref:Uncharacterized protein n=1 Tax=Gonapodya prolifera (strain JEL478) TaxID=1344416 RepID=A0A139AWC9_GONPJ|nr:hypothetical protein M427DRAFT_142675 [Gonapodya prolifera JEL478]|eukprot:KXS21051.1 hypothetical protein M427DRAFT_142675 [Gonapodya prolifera JEL478]
MEFDMADWIVGDPPTTELNVALTPMEDWCQMYLNNEAAPPTAQGLVHEGSSSGSATAQQPHKLVATHTFQDPLRNAASQQLPGLRGTQALQLQIQQQFQQPSAAQTFQNQGSYTVGIGPFTHVGAVTTGSLPPHFFHQRANVVQNQAIQLGAIEFCTEFRNIAPTNMIVDMPFNTVAPVAEPPTTLVQSMCTPQETDDFLRNHVLVPTEEGPRFKDRRTAEAFLSYNIAAQITAPNLSRSASGSSANSQHLTADLTSPSERADSSSGGSTPPNITESPGALSGVFEKHQDDGRLTEISGNFRGCPVCLGAGGRTPGAKGNWSLTNLPCIPVSERDEYRVKFLCNKEWDVLECRVKVQGRINKTKLYMCKVCQFRDGVHIFVCSGRNIKKHEHSLRG